LAVCRPPHVIVSAARNFAVYSEKFIVVPPRQIGIVIVDGNQGLLKALALYLSSDFAFYHAFLTSTQFGVQRGRATLDSLRQIPIPLLKLAPAELADWEALHDQLARTRPRLLQDSKQPEAELDESPVDDGQDALVEELNRRVSDALGLDEGERALVEDLVRIRVALNDGKIGRDAVNTAPKRELRTYAEWLQRESAVQSDGAQYSVTVLHDAHSGFVASGRSRRSQESSHGRLRSCFVRVTGLGCATGRRWTIGLKMSRSGQVPKNGLANAAGCPTSNLNMPANGKRCISDSRRRSSRGAATMPT
jgi:hypothetical protein